MIFSKSIKNIKLNKSAYEANNNTSKQKQESQSDGSDQEDNKLYSHPIIQHKKIHKVIVIGGGSNSGIKPLSQDIEKTKTRVLNIVKDGNRRNDQIKDSTMTVQTFGVFLRNLHSKVGESDLIDIVGEQNLLGIKISKTTGEMYFQSHSAAEKAIELLNDKQLFGMQIKSVAQYQEPKKEIASINNAKQTQDVREQKIIKVVRKDDYQSDLRMNQKSESIFSRIQFKKD